MSQTAPASGSGTAPDAIQLTERDLRQEVASSILLDILQERRTERRWKRFRRILTVALLAISIGLYVASYAGMLGYQTLPLDESVAIVPITGVIAEGTQASAEAVNPVLRRLFEAEKVKGIVLLINSGGGSPSEAERITKLLEEYRARTGKPVYAACSGMCASAAYLIALHTDGIYAGEYTWAGSIGAIMKGWDLRAVIERFEVDQRVFASGSMKDLMNPFKPMSAEMQTKLAALVNSTAETFIADVKAKRHGKIDPKANLFTGEVWTGRDAQKLGLVDEIGTLEHVLDQRFSGLPTRTYKPKRVTNSFFESILSEVRLGVRDALLEPNSFEVQM
jgi:protease-4